MDHWRGNPRTLNCCHIFNTRTHFHSKAFFSVIIFLLISRQKTLLFYKNKASVSTVEFCSIADNSHARDINTLELLSHCASACNWTAHFQNPRVLLTRSFWGDEDWWGCGHHQGDHRLPPRWRPVCPAKKHRTFSRSSCIDSAEFIPWSSHHHQWVIVILVFFISYMVLYHFFKMSFYFLGNLSCMQALMLSLIHIWRCRRWP